MADNYTEKNIKVYSGLSGIRAKPSMYLGPVDSNGLWMLVKEAADNCVDEFNAGRNKTCHIVIDNQRVYVIDAGSGIPVKPIVDPETKQKAPALKFIVSSHHAGGKFDDKAYGHSIGTHGLGIKCVNALSNYFQVWTKRDNKWWTTEYSKGKLVQDVVSVARLPKLPFGIKTPPKGTVVAFEADPTIFQKGSKLNLKQVMQWCELTAYLNGGLRVFLTTDKGTTEWHHPEGSKAYLDNLISKHKLEQLGKPLLVHEPNLDIAIGFTNYDGGDLVEAYTNSSHNSSGGIHLDTLWKILVKTIKPYAARNDFSPADIRDGLVGVINYKISNPQFSSQTKERLVDVRVKEPCETTLTAAFTSFWSKNKTLARQLCARAAELKSAKNELLHNKKLILALKETKQTKKGLLPGKFSDSASCPVEQRELYTVEGDSAGGSAKRARLKQYQAVLPLKGKPINVYKAKEGAAFTVSGKPDSNDLLNLLKCIGYNPTHQNPFEHLRVSKLILLSDADVDGLHINTLILAVIARYLPQMFDRGMVYIVKGPKYLLKHGGKNYFGNSLDDLRKQVPKNVSVDRAQYLKGWGEINAEPLREVAFDPATRNLLRVSGPSRKDIKEFVRLMGEDVEYRKALLGI